MLRPGTKILDIAETTEKINRNFGVYAVEGVLSHQMKRFVIDGTKCIPNKISLTQAPAEIDDEIEEGDVFAIDVVVTTAPPKKQRKGAAEEEEEYDPNLEIPAPREQGDRYKPTIFKRNVDTSYMLKLQTSRQILSEIQRKAQTFPFGLRQLETKVPRVGIKEMLDHNMLSVYPPLFAREGCIVAQMKMTCLVTDKQTLFVCGGNQTPPTTLPLVSGGADAAEFKSNKAVVDPALVTLLGQPLPVSKPKNKKKKKKTDAPSAAAAADEKKE